MISRQDVINAGFEIVTCDEKDCGRQAVVVLEDYSKCDEHDKEYRLTELLRAHEKRKKSSLTALKNRVIL
jgi:hypothetical protein